MSHDTPYLQLLSDIREFGELRQNRTGVDTISVFGTQMRFNLSKGFPLLTTKRVNFKAIVEELLWFLRGETNIRSLQAAGVHIWDAWADENGDLGPVYGSQWRSWPTTGEVSVAVEGYGVVEAPATIDQIADVIDSLRDNPESRRHIVTAWNPAEIDQMALPPCHCLFQFDVTADRRLNCQLYQRSADFFLGVPFNIASYALLTMMIAQVVGMKPGTFVWTGGDTHLYLNHGAQVFEQLHRAPRPSPTVVLNDAVKSIDDFTADDILLVGYDPHPSLKAEVAV